MCNESDSDDGGDREHPRRHQSVLARMERDQLLHVRRPWEEIVGHDAKMQG